MSTSYFGVLFSKAKDMDYNYAINHPQLIEMFYKYNGLPRYPSQLFELFFEGVFLFIIINIYTKKERKKFRQSIRFVFSVIWCIQNNH